MPDKTWYPGMYALRGVVKVLTLLSDADKSASHAVKDLDLLKKGANEKDAALIDSVINLTANSIGDIAAEVDIVLADSFIGKKLRGPQEKSPLEEVTLADSFMGKKLGGPQEKSPLEEVTLADSFMGKKLGGPQEKSPLEVVDLSESQLGKMLQSSEDIVDDLTKRTEKAIEAAKKAGASKSIIDYIGEIMSNLISALRNALNTFSKMITNLFTAKAEPIPKTKKIKPELSEEDKSLADVNRLFTIAQDKYDNKYKGIERQQRKKEAQHGQDQALGGAGAMFNDAQIKHDRQQQKKESQQGHNKAFIGARALFNEAQSKHDNQDSKRLEREQQKVVAQKGQKEGLDGARKMYTNAINKYEGKETQAQKIKAELNIQKDKNNVSSNPTPKK